jgi:putative endonuclease
MSATPHAPPTPDRHRRTPDARRALGRRGERFAAAYLLRRGFAPIERNARTRYGEIDLIAFDGTTLVFAEVKARRVAPGGGPPRPDQRPLAGLGLRQRMRLRRLAAAWLADSARRRPSAERIRFDAIGVLLRADDRPPRIEHVEGAW